MSSVLRRPLAVMAALALPAALALSGCAGAGAAPPASPATTSPTPPRVVTAPPASPAAVDSASEPPCRVEELRAALADVKGLRYSGPREKLETASSLAIREADLVCSIEHVYEDCIHATSECAAWPKPASTDEFGEQLIGLLGEIVESERGLAILLLLDARGSYPAGVAVERVLERRMGAAVATSSCAPPSNDEVAAARAELDTFAVIERRGARYVARAATEGERDDLAYFLAAVAEAGPPVGDADERSTASWTRAGAGKRADDEERDRLAQELSLARKRGDVASVRASARAYLETLGYPDKLRADEEGAFSWGGARYSYVMRDLAFALELAGESAAAAALYRRANPGGGACGTSVDYRWQQQVEGAIRSSETAGQCRAVVAERLLDIDHDGLGPHPRKPAGQGYGVRRLDAAGFDVARLYRGAAVTRNRDLPTEALERAIAAAPKAVRAAALERLRTRGAEAWEERVYAVEGLADTARAAAIPDLTDMLRSASPELRARVITALGELTRRSQIGPCPEDGLMGLGLSGSSSWSRHVRALGPSCQDQLNDAAARALASRLHRYLDDVDVTVRQATAETLGKVASPSSLAPLRRQLRDPAVTHYTGRCESDYQNRECVPGHGVRDAARESITRIEELLTQRASS